MLHDSCGIPASLWWLSRISLWVRQETDTSPANLVLTRRHSKSACAIVGRTLRNHLGSVTVESNQPKYSGTTFLELGGRGWDGEKMAISGTFGTRVVSKCYVTECPPHVSKPPNNRGAYTDLPRRGLDNPVDGPQYHQSPNRGATRVNALHVTNNVRLLRDLRRENGVHESTNPRYVL